MRNYLLIILSSVMLLAGCGTGELNESNDENGEVKDILEAENNAENIEENSEEPDNIEEPENAEEENEREEEDVPREHRNALKAAQNYIDMMAFSEKGLYEQLTSEYGDQYPEDAAQYAIENVEVDYNEEALEAAEGYQEIMPLSDQELFEQLTSEYGDQFTEEQAQYAIDNLAD